MEAIMLKAKDVKKFAKACGADICRIGSMDNWKGLKLSY